METEFWTCVDLNTSLRNTKKSAHEILTSLYRWHVNKLYHICTYSRLPANELLGSKEVDVVKINFFYEGAFFWFLLYHYIKMHGAKKRKI